MANVAVGTKIEFTSLENAGKQAGIYVGNGRAWIPGGAKPQLFTIKRISSQGKIDGTKLAEAKRIAQSLDTKKSVTKNEVVPSGKHFAAETADTIQRMKDVFQAVKDTNMTFYQETTGIPGDKPNMRRRRYRLNHYFYEQKESQNPAVDKHGNKRALPMTAVEDFMARFFGGLRRLNFEVHKPQAQGIEKDGKYFISYGFRSLDNKQAKFMLFLRSDKPYLNRDFWEVQKDANIYIDIEYYDHAIADKKEHTAAKKEAAKKAALSTPRLNIKASAGSVFDIVLGMLTLGSRQRTYILAMSAKSESFVLQYEGATRFGEDFRPEPVPYEWKDSAGNHHETNIYFLPNAAVSVFMHDANNKGLSTHLIKDDEDSREFIQYHKVTTNKGEIRLRDVGDADPTPPAPKPAPVAKPAKAPKKITREKDDPYFGLGQSEYYRQRLRYLWNSHKTTFNDWERKFVADIGARFKNGQNLTPKQWLSVKKILSKYKVGRNDLLATFDES